LLFGQSPQAAVGGAIGGLLGGAGGGFAGSLLGTALGEIEAAKARTKELALELGLSSAQAKELSTAFELAGRNSQQLEAAITNIQGLGLSTNETASAIKIAVELSTEYGGSIEKVAQAFADTLESGKVSISTLNKFTAQGIPIQDELAAKFGVSRTKLLEMAKDGQISVQQVTDVLVAMGREAEKTADKGKTGFDRFTQAVTNIATAIAGAAGALLKTLVPALDVVLTRLASIITRATQAINLITNATVGEASAALARSGFARGTFTASKGNIDDLTKGLRSLQPRLATTKEQFDLIAATTQRYRIELQQYGGALGEYAVGTAQVELGRVIADLGAARTKLDAASAPAQITDIVAPVNLPPSGGAGKKGPQPPKDRTQQLIEEFNAIVAIGKAEDQIRDLLFDGRELLAAEVKLAKQLADIERDRNKALLGANFESEKAVINKIAEARIVDAQLQTEDEIRAIKQQRFEKELDIQEAVRSSVQVFTDLRREQDAELQYAKTYSRLVMEGLLPAEAARLANFEKLVSEQLKAVETQLTITQAAILEAEARGMSVTKLQEELDLLNKKKEAIEGAAAAGPGEGPTDAQRLQDAIATARGELNNLTDPINQVIAGARAIGDAFQQAFMGLVSGAMTGQQALAAFFKGVGDHFLDMASKMIAKLLEIYILQTVLGFIGGAAGGGNAATALATNPNVALYSTPLPGFAEGGFVTGPTRAVVGEGGEPEYIIPASKMSAAMKRYGGGARGSAVIPTSGDTSEAGGNATPVNGAIDVRYTVERINSVDYVTADQFEQGMQQAAMQGAQQGEQRTLRRLQTSISTRRRLGV
jgi:tape measure domain-containing protein